VSGGFALRWSRAAELTWLTWEGQGVTAVFPARGGGVSGPPWDTLNLGLAVGDAPADVRENRRRLCEAVGLETDRLVVPRQVHGTALCRVGEAEAGRGAHDVETGIDDCDGLLTDVPRLGLGVTTADCLPVVIAAETAGGVALAAVHAGWRGVLARLAGRAAVALADGGRLLGAVVGPSIGPCCFVVDDALRARFAARYPGVVHGSAVDLWAAAGADLAAAGLAAGDLTIAGVCTSCDRRFFSHRRDAGLTGRHLTIAWRQG
jgi:polyphenol oxidase